MTDQSILSDCWYGYNIEELENAGFQHLKRDCRYNFVDPETKILSMVYEYTNTIESVGSAKWRNKKHRSVTTYI